MYRTLGELKDTIDQLIESQGENAGCAAFIFTKGDVFEFNGEENEEVHFSEDFTETVLQDVGGTDYIYEQIGEVIDDTIQFLKNLKSYSNLSV